MSMGETSWHPVCLIRPGDGKHVAVQVTTDNFMKLFDIVNRCLNAHAAAAKEGVHTPTRKLRRTRSNPQKPKGPPDGREYYVNGKEWVTCTYNTDVVPPRNRSNKSVKGSANRRFIKNSPVKPTGVSSGPRPDATERASAGDSKRNRHGGRTQIKGHVAVAPQRDDDDGKSSSSEMFGVISSV